jgi:hypothetical protein
MRAISGSLDGRFHARMVDIYRRAKVETGYHATYFLQMVSGRGGVDAARHPLHSTTVSDGFAALWERHRLDLSVEALVPEEEFDELFTDDERDIARDRLAEYGYRPGA